VRILRPATILLAAVVAAACAPFHPESGPPSGGTAVEPGVRVVQTAMAQVGAPYRYGGADPSQGFDCSGLVAWAFGQQGIAVPRTAAQQFAAATPLTGAQLHPGDLVFFRLKAPRGAVDHVGIFTGQGRFVHAPQSGRSVSVASLDDEFYRSRLAGFGRLPTASRPHAAPR
jgi:cell wall-associated NlpC family hydrolase